MARPLRIEFPGAIYHVMSRGNERQPIVRDDVDRRKRIEWLSRTVETHAWRMHAFVLMDNHDHLFVETPEGNLAAGMHLLNSSYTGYFNRRHGRSGHLFQGRYKGHLIEEEGYFLQVSRYIHLNPVRAGLVDRPDQWPWSSFPSYRWARRAVDWITHERVLGEFARDASAARQAYAHFVTAGVVDPPPSPFAKAVGGLLLGSKAFVERIGKLLDDRPDDPDVPQLEPLRSRPPLQRIVAVVCDHFGQSPSDWGSGRRRNDAARAVAAYLARRCFGYPLTDIAQTLGYRGHSSVNSAVRRVEQGNRQLQKTVADLTRRLGSGRR